MLPETVAKMPWTSKFQVKHGAQLSVTVLDSSAGQDTAAAINAAFAEVVDTCIEQSLFHLLCGTHSELSAVISARYDEPVYIERFATALFGVVQRGAHLIAYRGSPGPDMGIWVSRRSPHLYTYPGLLDSTVAGGVKLGASPLRSIVEESDEEASLPADVVRSAVRSRGLISHMSLTGRGFPGEQGLVVPDYIYVYDMALPETMVPRPRDGEVGEFHCMTVREVQDALLNDEFKPDSAAVMVDFLVRHSIITPENGHDFVEISMRLHRRLPFRVG